MSSALAELLHHVQMSDEDIARLAALHPRLAPFFPAIADQFYAAVGSDPKTAAVLSSEPHVERVRLELIDWMSSGLLGPYDDGFHAKRSRIGRGQLQIGLAQHYMILAMNVVRLAYQQHATELCTPAELMPTLRAVHKLLDLELAIMMHHYQLDSEERLLARDRRLQAERIVSMQTMTAGLAHEIRNPLNAAKLQLELLGRRLRRGTNDPKLTEPSELAQHEIGRLTHLLADFLAFARPPDLQIAERDVAAILHDTCKLVQSNAHLRDVTLVVDGCDAPVLAELDAAKLHQIVDNLVRNAIDAAQVGGRVAVSLSSTETLITISVSDDGAGISDELHARIYEPFFTTKTAGTGLGMSIVHSLVALQGGSIALSDNAPGARFDVTLPRRQ